MKIEKVVILFIAVLIGILASGAAFFLYQTTKVVSNSNTKTISINPKPIAKITPKSGIFLTIDSPKDEDVMPSRTIEVIGKTTKDAAILIAGSSSDQVVTPAKNGDFSATVTLDDGENYLEVTAIAPSGEETKVIRTITVSSETF